MSHVEEILQAIFIGLAVANFLLNIGCVLKAIELCKENLVLLNDRTLSIEKHLGQIIYKRIYATMFMACRRVSHNTNAIACGRIKSVRIKSVSLIHIAAHGNAERGEIALAPAGSTGGIPQEDDYLLKMSDISQVQVRAKLVVLSCCHSGRGQLRTEEAVGIPRAFLGPGARSVLVALWALEDRATEQLMSCFYENLVREKSASESLHEAMKWMRDNGFTEVSEWAPFILIGDNVTFTFGK